MMKVGVLGQVIEIPPRHALKAQDEHREKERVEACEQEQERPVGDPPVVHPAGYLREPVMEGREKAEGRAPELYVMKVGHDEVGVVQVDIDRKRAEDEPGQAAYREKEDEGERVVERGVHHNGTLVHGPDTVVALDGARYGHEKGEQRKINRGRVAVAAHEHVVAPYERAQGRDRDARIV